MADRPGSPCRETEPDFKCDFLSNLGFTVENRVFKEEDGKPIPLYVKVHNATGVAFYVDITGKTLNYPLPEEIYAVKRIPGDIPASFKAGMIASIGLDIAGVVFERSSDLTVVRRDNGTIVETSITSTKPMETSTDYLTYPLVTANDLSDENLNDSVSWASRSISNMAIIQCNEGLNEIIATSDYYGTKLKEFHGLFIEFTKESKRSIEKFMSVIEKWHDQIDSPEKSDSLRILVENLAEKRRDYSTIIPLSRAIVDQKRAIEGMISDIERLTRVVKVRMDGLGLVHKK